VKNALVTIIDDEPDVRLAIEMLLKSVGYSVQSFESAQDYWAQYDPLQPGCMILDVRMPGMSGIELQEQLNKLDYCSPIIMTSGHGEIPLAVKAIKNGALDFLQKPFSDQILLDHVSQALKEDEESRQLLSEKNLVLKRHKTLTPRELEIFQGVTSGKLNKTIASDLNVSTRTVEIHRSNMMEKMAVTNLPSLMRCVSIIEEVNHL